MLVVIPYGGLGNRLMALMSARVLAEHIGCTHAVCWRPQQHLKHSNCPVSALFEGIDSLAFPPYAADRGPKSLDSGTGRVTLLSNSTTRNG